MVQSDLKHDQLEDDRDAVETPRVVLSVLENLLGQPCQKPHQKPPTDVKCVAEDVNISESMMMSTLPRVFSPELDVLLAHFRRLHRVRHRSVFHPSGVVIDSTLVDMLSRIINNAEEKTILQCFRKTLHFHSSIRMNYLCASSVGIYGIYI